MTYKVGDFIELANGKTVRLTAETAEIANAAVRAVAVLTESEQQDNG